MTERVREQVNEYLAKWFDKGREWGNKPINNITLDALESDGAALLAIDGLEIRADDQSLPELNLPTLTGNKSLEIAMESFAKKIRNDMLATGFVKVVK